MARAEFDRSGVAHLSPANSALAPSPVRKGVQKMMGVGVMPRGETFLWVICPTTSFAPEAACLARSTQDLLDIAGELTAKGVTFKILNIDLDTGTPTGKLMLTMLGAIATFEREMMLERQCGGRAPCRRQGDGSRRNPPGEAAQEAMMLPGRRSSTGGPKFAGAGAR